MTAATQSRQANGLLVSVSIPSTVPAFRLQLHDVLALPELPDHPLTVNNVRPRPGLTGHLLNDLRGVTKPRTPRDDEPVSPPSMPRHAEATGQLCGTTTATPLDLVAHGKPQTWVHRLP